MQNSTPSLNGSTESLSNELTTSPSAQQPVAPAPTAATPTAPLPLGIDEQFLEVIDDLVLEIKKCAANALGWRITIGTKLHEFRAALGTEDWNLLLHSGRLPFSPRTAQTFARIGQHAVLGDLRKLHQLPDSISALNLLAALPPPVIAQALLSQTIHPNTTLGEAKSFVTAHRPAKAASVDTTTDKRLLCL